MTYFLDFRASAVGGGVNDAGPIFYQGDGTTAQPQWQLIQGPQIATQVAGRSLLFAAHGFNVNRADGANELGQLNQYLGLTPPNVFIGILWPGDAVIPFVNYPFAGDAASRCGRMLATFCNTACTSAQSLSFVSHSLGVRLVLEAVVGLNRKARSVCLTAPAINRDCLIAEYAAATKKSCRISILASHNDDVLKLAYPAGDPLSDLLHADHNPFQPALGLDGPPTPTSPPIVAPWQIADDEDFGHLNYLPPTPTSLLPLNRTQWREAADFMKRDFFRQTQTWPVMSVA
jgi:hypothetical protein